MMSLDDGACNGKANPHSLLLGREEGIENLIKLVG
jgi:hypothetical protein